MHIIDSICEEIAVWRSGMAVPYHKAGLMMAFLTCIIFSIVFQHTVVFEGEISVIDLDNSAYSTKLIEKINSSSYIRVGHIYHNAVSVKNLTANDRNLGVLYIPQGFYEKVRNNHETVNIGYLADYSNAAQNAEVQESLNEIIGSVNGDAGFVTAELAGIAPAAVNPIALKTRELYNPTYSATPGLVLPFINFFSSIILGLSTLMIVGRLKVSQQWERVLFWGPWAFMARVLPFSLVYATAISLPTAVMVNFGQLPFMSSYLIYLPSIFMTGICLSLIALNMTWHTTNPASGPSFMILFVPPGFVIGGATMAVGILPLWAYKMSYLFPLVWQYRFFRDISLRGADLGILIYYGYYMIYILLLAGLLYVRFMNARRKAFFSNSSTPIKV